MLVEQKVICIRVLFRQPFINIFLITPKSEAIITILLVGLLPSVNDRLSNYCGTPKDIEQSQPPRNILHNLTIWIGWQM